MQTAGYPELSYKAEWLELKPRLKERLSYLYAQLAKPGTSFDDTNVLRGRIAEIVGFLEAVEPSVIIPATPPAADQGGGY